MLLPINSSISLLVIFVLATACQSVLSDEQVFKINKLNLVWHKAQHSLGPGKLKDLKNDLTKHEFDELTLKKMKAHNQDKDGLFEAAVRKKLLTIMTKYALEKYHDDIHPPVEAEHERKKENLKNVKDTNTDGQFKAQFRDKRLDKLWKKAEQSSFTQEQLMLLYDEFQHQQDKLDEHYETLNTIEQQLDSSSRDSEKSINSIESDLEIDHDGKKKNKKDRLSKESSSEKKVRLDSNVQQALKEKYSNIKKNIDQLHRKIVSGTIDDSAGPFQEAPVNELWQAALKANFTADELDSLKEELGHYQTRIQKLKHYEVQFEKNKIVSESKKDSTNDELNDETKHLRKRVKELTYKVDKTHKSLEDRIVNKRDEL